jgi:hypothetical protein
MIPLTVVPLPSLLPRIGIVVAVVCVGGCGRMRYFT